jgi:two-component system, probable response regulator PhcQ
MNRAVLLVDDDNRVLAWLVRTLRKQPYQIYTARNGEEAVWILKTRTIDVVVTDERMPGMSGGELLAWMTDHCPNVMRIVLTGYAEADTAIRAINEWDVCAFLTKPCNEAHLAIVVQKMLQRKERLDKDRQVVETSGQQVLGLERLNQDLQFQTRIVCQDMQLPLRNILECCRGLEQQCRPDAQARAWLDEAGRAVAAMQQLTAHLETIAGHEPALSAGSV